MEMRSVCNNTNYRAFICYLCRAIQHCQDVHCQGPLSCYWSCVVAGAWLPSPTSGGGPNLLRENDGGRSMAAHLTTPRLPCSNFYLALSLFPCGEHSDLPVRGFPQCTYIERSSHCKIPTENMESQARNHIPKTLWDRSKSRKELGP